MTVPPKTTTVTSIRMNPEVIARFEEHIATVTDPETKAFLTGLRNQIGYLVESLQNIVPYAEISNEALHTAIFAIQHIANDWTMMTEAVGKEVDFSEEVAELLERMAVLTEMMQAIEIANERKNP